MASSLFPQCLLFPIFSVYLPAILLTVLGPNEPPCRSTTRSSVTASLLWRLPAQAEEKCSWRASCASLAALCGPYADNGTVFHTMATICPPGSGGGTPMLGGGDNDTGGWLRVVAGEDRLCLLLKVEGTRKAWCRRGREGRARAVQSGCTPACVNMKVLHDTRMCDTSNASCEDMQFHTCKNLWCGPIECLDAFMPGYARALA